MSYLYHCDMCHGESADVMCIGDIEDVKIYDELVEQDLRDEDNVCKNCLSALREITRRRDRRTH